MPLNNEAVVGLLAGWLPQQRWYAGKGRDVARHTVESVAELAATADARLHHLVVRVDYVAGPAEHYQLLVGERTELPNRLEHAIIGAADSAVVYEAAHDPELTSTLLELIAEGTSRGGIAFAHSPDAQID